MSDKGTNTGKTMGLGYFNLARGLGMVLIVLGHSVNLYLDPSVEGSSGLFSGAGSVLGGGMMAAFFMVSGCGFYRRSFKKCLSIQFRLLLQPYFIVAAAVILSKVLLAVIRQRSFLKNGGELILTYLLGLNAEGGGVFLGIPVESVSIFWFVLALFGGWMIYNGIRQQKEDGIRMLLVLLCILGSWLLTLVSDVWAWCLPMVLLAAGYLAAGELIKEHGLLEQKLPWPWLLALSAIAVLSMAYGEVNIVACVWKAGLLDVAGTFCVGFFLLKGYACFMKKERRGRIVSILEEIGFQSIWIVCIHAYEKTIFPWYRIADALSDHPFVGVVICFAARCVVMYGIYLVVHLVWEKLRRDRFRRKDKNVF